MDRIRCPARWATGIGLAAMVAGLVVLVLYAASEVRSDPTISLADGYWIGRLPWTAVGVELAVAGATLATLTGYAAAWLDRIAVRLVLSSAAFAVVAFWWFIAMLPQPGGAFCPTCPPPSPDPIAVAYSSPTTTGVLLLIPAAIIGVLALTVRGSPHRARGSSPS